MWTRGVVIRSAVGLIYPIYRSFLAFMSEDTSDDMIWLRYWAVLGILSLIELVVDPMVDYFPGYLLAKCAFLMWCMAPMANHGANLILSQVDLTSCLFCRHAWFQCLLFHQIIFPLFKKHYLQVKKDPAEEKISWNTYLKLKKDPVVEKNSWTNLFKRKRCWTGKLLVI